MPGGTSISMRGLRWRRWTRPGGTSRCAGSGGGRSRPEASSWGGRRRACHGAPATRPRGLPVILLQPPPPPTATAGPGSARPRSTMSRNAVRPCQALLGVAARSTGPGAGRSGSPSRRGRDLHPALPGGRHEPARVVGHPALDEERFPLNGRQPAQDLLRPLPPRRGEALADHGSERNARQATRCSRSR